MQQKQENLRLLEQTRWSIQKHESELAYKASPSLVTHLLLAGHNVSNSMSGSIRFLILSKGHLRPSHL
jgi:hypothetical protein